MAFALGENRHQHVGTRDLLAARGLDMDHGTLDHALESGRRLGIVVAVVDQVLQFAFEIGGQTPAQLVQLDIARPHHRGGVLIVEQGKQKVLKRGVLMMTLIGERQGAMQGLFEVARERWHVRSRYNE